MLSQPKIRVIICNRYTLFREGIKALLANGGGIEVVAEASTPKKLLRMAERLHPDVVLIDADTGDAFGAEVIRRLNEMSPHAKVLILSMNDDEKVASECIAAGAAGWLRKGVESEQLKRTIHNACRGATFAA